MRIPRALALLVPALLAIPSAAAAQAAGGITVTLESVSENGVIIRDLSDDDILIRGYNEAECAVPDTIVSTFRVQNLPAGTTFLDAWIGSSTDDCSTTTARQTGDQRVCVHLGTDPDVQAIGGTFTMRLTDMLDPDDNACESSPAQGETFRLWLFAGGNTETTGTVTLDQYGFVSFTVDPTAPTVPTIESDAEVAGDASVPVEWSVGTEPNLRFNVYVDTSISACGDAGSLNPGDPPSGTPFAEELTAATVNVSTESLGLAVGASALIYVTALDRSYNESNLSTAVCITRVQTVGFCDALSSSGEECTNSCTVRAPRGGAGPSLVLMGLALVALAIRRRTRS